MEEKDKNGIDVVDTGKKCKGPSPSSGFMWSIMLVLLIAGLCGMLFAGIAHMDGSGSPAATAVVVGDESSSVTVSGHGSLIVPADMASFSVTVSSTKATGAEARAEVNTRLTSVLDVLLERYGIAASDIRTSSVDLRPEYEWKDGVSILRGQTMTQRLSVTVRDLAVLAEAYETLADMDVRLSSITFGLSDKERRAEEAVARAILDAEHRADLCASLVGLERGRVMHIDESTVQPIGMRNLSMAYADSPSTPLSETLPNEIEITADVTATWSLE